MVITHVDDFNVGGTSKFVDETTDLIKRNMTVSKVEDDRFRFCGVDVRLTKDKEIVISMEDYAEALQEINIEKDRKKKAELNKWEMTEFRRVVGQVSWLASNVRPDLAYNAVWMSKHIQKAVVEDLHYANKIIKKAKMRQNAVKYVYIGKPDKLVVYTYTDAAYRAGEGSFSCVGGQFALVGLEDSSVVNPAFWKAKSIVRETCQSAKDAETLSATMACDIGVSLANQLEELYFGGDGRKIPVVVFSDHLGLLESVASTHEVERRVMRQYVYNLKRQLMLGRIHSFNWTPTEYQLADVLTKEKVCGDMLDGVIAKNRCYQVVDRHNAVTWDGMEMDTAGMTLREKPTKNVT